MALLPITARAQDLLLLAGWTDADDRSSPSYGWQMEINEAFTKYFNGSISWINEGHVAGHHRDGGALQLWLKTPHWRDHVEQAVLTAANRPQGSMDCFRSGWNGRGPHTAA